jgi:C-methyltransferase C-terminal domain/Glycosyl transferase family 2/Putative zinc binding domain/Methyltransferase domain
VSERLTATLLLPTLNEIEAVRVIVPQLRREWVDEIIVVDGGSTDGTVEYMRAAGLTVHMQTVRGYGEGIKQGMQLAKGDIIVEFNPDGNSIPEDIPRIIAKVREGYDLVIGSRYREGAKSDDDDLLTAFGNWMFTRIVNLLFRTSYTDALVGFRAYRRKAALALALDAPGLSWPCQSSTRFARAGLRVVEIPAHEPARIGGKRKMMPFRTGLQISRLILQEFLAFRPPFGEASKAEVMSGVVMGSANRPTPFKLLQRCKICGSPALTDVIGIPPQYLSPTFTRNNEEEAELAKIQVPLTMTLCDRSRNPAGCGLLQLREEVDPELLYRRYFYRSATSETMRNDLKDVIEDVRRRVELAPNDIVIDIGANDCTTLAFYPDHLRRVGFEPARNIDWSQVDRSITVINDYFSAALFEQRFPGAKARALSCNAMFYDLSDPNSFVADVKRILAPDGVWCIQLSYLPLMLVNMNFYDICHEHLSYYSLETLQQVLERNGLAAFDASTNSVNGGSLRAFVTHPDNARAFTEAGRRNLDQLLDRERSQRLDQASTYREYFERIRDLANRVNKFLDAEIENGGRIFGLGASTKGNVLLQLFGITKERMPYISERNPEKVGLHTLGTDFELISEQHARDLRPTSMVVLPWYFKNEIVARERDYLRQGGKLLFPMPYAHVVTKDGEARL